MSKRILVAFLAAAITVSTASVAAALITGSTGTQVIRLATPPASVKLNALQSATSVYAFDERQGVTLASALAVDAVNPGTYTSFPNGHATIPAGTVVDSHLIHSDVPSTKFNSHRTGSVTFNGDVLGVIASTGRLAASDSLGAPGTLYAGATTWRGLEGTESGTSATADRVAISLNHRTVAFDIQTFVLDEIRVITRHTKTLTTTIADTPDPVIAGDNVTYTLTVTNNASSTAANVQVQDQFPGATLVSATSAGGCTGTSLVTCGLGTIAAGGSASATIVVTSPSTVPIGGTISNTATSPPGLSPATATTTVIAPALTTTITDVPDPVTAGDNVQYTLTVTNNGVVPVASAHVVDTLPAGTTLDLATAPGGCAGTGPVDCTLGPLGLGASAQAQIVITAPSVVPAGGTTITDTAVASPGTNPSASEDTAVEQPADGVASGFVLPGGSITIPGDNPASLTLPDSGPGAPVVITQGPGSFCDGPCADPATTISDFGGYTDPTQPIQLVLTYTFPDSPTSLTDAATAFGSTIYKNDTPDPNAGVVVPSCTTLGSGVAIPHPCIDAHTIAQPSPNSFVVTFTILYISGDPHFARK